MKTIITFVKLETKIFHHKSYLTVDYESRKFESVYSNKVRAGKRRTYFFDVRQTRGNDYYITITESTKRFEDDSYARHKIFLYKEDFNRFLGGLDDAIKHVKTELMPDYDYDEFDRRHAEFEERKRQEALEEKNAAEKPEPLESKAFKDDDGDKTVDDDDFDAEDLKW